MRKFTFSSFSQLLLGRPLKSTELSHEQLPKWKALPIFSSDALSSIGYGPEQIALILVLPGLILYDYFPWIIAAIVALLFIITISYAQVIKVYPKGGGSYAIAKEYLGEYPALLAAASLCADYVLTVAVSVSSGTAALISAWPELAPYQISIDLFAVFAILMLINLRGLREASNAFVWPTYAFLVTALLLAGSGLYQIFALDRPPVILPQATTTITPAVLYFLLLRAFANGCSSMTGVEAIANGSGAFREPAAKNAKETIAMMAIILATLLLSTGFLIVHFGLLPSADRTLLSLLAETVWGRGTGYFIFQLLTTVILYLAANTAYNGLPPLMSILAQDGYLPRYLAHRGSRLSFANGIVLLSLCAGGLIVAFHGDVEHLISLYALGVFLSFMLAQAGLCVHWFRQQPRPHGRLLLNGFGALVTATVVSIILVTKFIHGAWIILIFLPILMRIFKAIHTHYEKVQEALTLSSKELTEILAQPVNDHHVLLPVARPTRAVARALRYARAITDDAHIHALHIAIDAEAGERLRQKWQRLLPAISMAVVPSPYRDFSEPLLDYIKEFRDRHPDASITILIPEFEVGMGWERLLHNQQGLQLRWQLLNRFDVIVTTVPLLLTDPHDKKGK
ncbi:MAG: APC family permease [Negativicoccus succinicivorans]|uniref:APC family permease n=1 Tax=Negativicoccus succinicivorans TaxID=620903 RepID=UPI0026EC2297|nr:APC family permease [Negativicoccus succinicivorans]MBS5887285.1 APC family permease [Negativicoccus succinicivorans]MDU5026882.1 APC family permease [Negativicoccus succinicivorans]